jgi:hypothetical protein
MPFAGSFGGGGGSVPMLDTTGGYDPLGLNPYQFPKEDPLAFLGNNYDFSKIFQ